MTPDDSGQKQMSPTLISSNPKEGQVVENSHSSQKQQQQQQHLLPKKINTKLPATHDSQESGLDNERSLFVNSPIPTEANEAFATSCESLAANKSSNLQKQDTWGNSESESASAPSTPGLKDKSNSKNSNSRDRIDSDDEASPTTSATPTSINAKSDISDSFDDDRASTNSGIKATNTLPIGGGSERTRRQMLHRSMVPPPINTEDANRDAEKKLRYKLLLSSPSPPSEFMPETPCNAGQPGNVSIGVATEVNRRYRRSMEVSIDAHAYYYNFDNVVGQSLMAIFDGHAGKQAAEWCGKNFCSVFKELKTKNPDMSIPEVLNQAFLETDKRLVTETKSHSGCTAVVSFLKVDHVEVDGKPATKRTLYCANAGDARAVLSRGGKAARLTYDHKGDDIREARRIMDSGGFVFNGRVNGVLAVTRALGDSTMKQVVIGNPYTTETPLNDSDDLLIIACDGLWDVCSDQKAVDLIKDVQDPTKASQILIDYALDNTSMDNITVMVVRVHT
ncbi:phosphatase 2C [Mycoemilia scoparia]|uniref:Phosphatase 2C n=1 Tax=Mycoemilia scoparia TaxID=417184 RepID=A0A9W8A2Z1_9FUNG|nr:phosphatase 2C [Mycoemilia scoparia]